MLDEVREVDVGQVLGVVVEFLLALAVAERLGEPARIAHLDHTRVVASNDEVPAGLCLDARAKRQSVIELAIGDVDDLEVGREALVHGFGDDEELVGVVAQRLGAQLGLGDRRQICEVVIEPGQRGDDLVPDTEDTTGILLDQQGIEPFVAQPDVVADGHPSLFPILCREVEKGRVEDAEHRVHLSLPNVLLAAGVENLPKVEDVDTRIGHEALGRLRALLTEHGRERAFGARQAPLGHFVEAGVQSHVAQGSDRSDERHQGEGVVGASLGLCHGRL